MNCIIDMSYCFEESAKLSSTFKRKARKTHRCDECERIIQPGETYEINRGLWSEGFYEHKTCGVCEELRSRFFCSWLMGSVIDDLAAEIEENDIPVESLEGLSPAAIEVIDKLIREVNDGL